MLCCTGTERSREPPQQKHMYTCLAHVHAHLHSNLDALVRMLIRLHTHLRVHVCMWLHPHSHLQKHLHLQMEEARTGGTCIHMHFRHVFAYRCICTYMCMYTHMHFHVHTCIHMYRCEHKHEHALRELKRVMTACGAVAHAGLLRLSPRTCVQTCTSTCVREKTKTGTCTPSWPLCLTYAEHWGRRRFVTPALRASGVQHDDHSGLFSPIASSSWRFTKTS